MKISIIPLLIGIALIVGTYTEALIVDWYWILLCFILWAGMSYKEISNLNKRDRRPRPVYLTN